MESIEDIHSSEDELDFAVFNEKFDNFLRMEKKCSDHDNSDNSDEIIIFIWKGEKLEW